MRGSYRNDGHGESGDDEPWVSSTASKEGQEEHSVGAGIEGPVQEEPFLLLDAVH